MKPVPFIQIVLQRSEGDCGVSCLAMFLGRTYEEVLLAFRQPLTTMKYGARMQDLQRVSVRLGDPLKWHRRIDMESQEGILAVCFPKAAFSHVVVLKGELIIDTDATLWEPQDYLDYHEARPTSILTRD